MKKILIIEDELELRENIQEILELENFETVVAADGFIGLSLAKEVQPDLIICDIMMPNLDGFGVLEALHQDPVSATIPFIFLTAKSDRLDFRRGMEIGANDYLIKPFLAQELLTAITTQLKKQAIFKQESQKKLDTLRSNISYSLPHELLTPLNGIMGLSSLLIEDYKNMPESEILECLQDIHNSGTRLLESIKKFLLFSDLKLTLANPARIQVYRQTKYQTPTKDLIALVANEIAQRSQRQNDLHLQLENILVDIAPTHLHKIVEEIVDNAFKFSDIGTPILLTAKAEGSKFVLDVSDRGRGLSETGINEIGAYMQFERKHYEQQGSGLGLAIVQLVIELYGGSFAIESKVKEHTTVHITLDLSS